MIQRRTCRQAALALALAVPAAMAGDDVQMPAPRSDGGVTYVTGGIGKDEARLMRAARLQHPLALTFAVDDGGSRQYTSRVRVTIEDAAGAQVLDARSDGPFLLADLPAGSYQVTARNDDGRLQRRSVRVPEQGSADVLFLWENQMVSGCSCAMPQKPR